MPGADTPRPAAPSGHGQAPAPGTLPENDAAAASPGPAGRRRGKDLPVVSVPHEDETAARDMADLFDEDRVTHRHGNAEPEGD